MEQKEKKLGLTLIKFIQFKGFVLLITGVVLLVFPKATLATLLFILGIYWFVDGISTIITAIQVRKTQSSWGWGLFTGILGVVAGAVVLSKPMLSSELTTSFLMWFLGISALFYGVSGFITGYQLPKSRGKTSMIWGGVFSILFGFILISSPYMSAITIVSAIGVMALIGGVSILIVAYKMKERFKYTH